MKANNRTSETLSRLMKMSWDIQKATPRNGKPLNRSTSLHAAWVIVSNEDITVYYLLRKLSGRHIPTQKAINQYSLFNH